MLLSSLCNWRRVNLPFETANGYIPLCAHARARTHVRALCLLAVSNGNLIHKLEYDHICNWRSGGDGHEANTPQTVLRMPPMEAVGEPRAARQSVLPLRPTCDAGASPCADTVA